MALWICAWSVHERIEMHQQRTIGRDCFQKPFRRRCRECGIEIKGERVESRIDNAPEFDAQSRISARQKGRITGCHAFLPAESIWPSSPDSRWP